jgi:hypothetical protein
VLGAAGGAGLAAGQHVAVAATLARAWTLGGVTVGAALAIGVIAAAPAAFASVARDPVRELQES